MRHTNKIVLTGAVFVAAALVMSMAVGSVAASEHEGEDSGLVFENQSLNDNGEVTAEIDEGTLEEDGWLVVTYTDEDSPGDPATVVAGVAELGENDTAASVAVEEDGGFPGEHTAHVITELSLGGYEPGDVGISDVTQSNIVVSETAVVSGDFDVYEPTGDVATVTFENQTADNGTVVVSSTNLPEGGFVTIHDDSLLEGDALGSVVGTSEYLEPGEHENVAVDADLHDEEGGEHSHTYIAMPHFDTNDNEEYDFVDEEGGADGPYTANGSAVTDSASVTVGSEGPSVEFEDQTLGDDGAVDVSVNQASLEQGNWLVVTYEAEDGLTIAGVSQLQDSTDLSVTVDDAGGFPGTHTAHVISELSSDYAPGDTVSEETAGNVLVNSDAEVTQESDSMDEGEDGMDDGMDDGEDGMDDGMDDGEDGMDGNETDGGEDGMDENETDGGEDGGEDGGDEGMPGFTAVAGLVALLSVALIAARRRE